MKASVLLYLGLLSALAYGNVIGRRDGEEQPQVECTIEGTFPMPGDCQDYYQCQPTGGSADLQLTILFCPNGTIFDISDKECRNASLVTSRSDCLNDEIPTTDDASIAGQMMSMVRGAIEICRHIRNIDNCEITILSSVPLNKRDYQAKINDFVESYNHDLNITKANMRVWRSGQDIVTDIRSTYALAKKYESEFDRKYNINKRRMTTLTTQNSKLIQRLQKDINDLKVDIEDAKAEAEAEGADQDFKDLLLFGISNNEKKLRQKEAQLENSSPAALKLNELVAFLGYIKDDAVRIMDKAAASHVRIDDLSRIVVNMTDSFHTHLYNAKHSMEDLEKEDMERKTQLRTTQDSIVQLQNKKTQLKNDIKSVYNEITSSQQRSKDLLEKILNQNQTFSSIQNIHCRPGGAFMTMLDHITIPHQYRGKLCEYIMKITGTTYDGEHNNELFDEEQKLLKSLANQHKDLLDGIPPLDTNISKSRNRIPSINDRIRSISWELREFKLFIPDLEKLVEVMTSILPDMHSSIQGLQKVESTFQLITEEIDRMISIANNADNDVQRDEALNLVSQALLTFQNEIDHSGEKIPEIRQCSRLA